MLYSCAVIIIKPTSAVPLRGDTNHTGDHRNFFALSTLSYLKKVVVKESMSDISKTSKDSLVPSTKESDLQIVFIYCSMVRENTFTNVCCINHACHNKPDMERFRLYLQSRICMLLTFEIMYTNAFRDCYNSIFVRA